MKKYNIGLVVGKFSPYHKGHRHLIRTAFEQCQDVVVLCYSKPPIVKWEDQYDAIVADFPKLAGFSGSMLIFVDDDVLSQGLENPDNRWVVPDNNAPSYQHRSFCADVLQLVLYPNMLAGIDAVFSSEDYGDGFADFLSFRWNRGVEHVLVDKDRIQYPVSATKLRNGELVWEEWTTMEKESLINGKETST